MKKKRINKNKFSACGELAMKHRNFYPPGEMFNENSYVRLQMLNIT